jgi:hypothetical protein
MAGLGRKTFAQEEILRAADVNGYLMDQSVMRFADSAARGSAIGTAVAEGMVSYLDDANAVEVYDGSDWKPVGQDLTTGTSGFTALSAGTAGISYQPVSHNYIINGAFDVWQRGTSFSSTGSFVFTADRHGIGSPGDSTTITQQTLTPGDIEAIGFGDARFYARFGIVSQNGGARFVVGHVEDARTLAGQEVTLSFWARSSDITELRTQSQQFFGSGGSAQVLGPTRDVTISSSWQRYSFTSNLGTMAGKTIGPNSGLAFWIFPVSATETGSVDIWGVQLEAGSVATPFKRHAPSEALEKLACQRYYWRVTGGNGGYAPYGVGMGRNTTTAEIIVTHPTGMRISPTTLDFSSLALGDGSNAFAVTGLVVSFSNANYSLLTATVASGLAQYRPYSLLNNNNSTTAHLGMPAEL